MWRMVVAMIVLAGCDDRQCRCVLIYNEQDIVVLDPNGQPVIQLTPKTVRADGTDITPSALIGQTRGSYVVLDTFSAPDLDPTPQRIVFSVTLGEHTASIERMGSTDDCGCTYIWRGPTTMTFPY